MAYNPTPTERVRERDRESDRDTDRDRERQRETGGEIGNTIYFFSNEIKDVSMVQKKSVGIEFRIVF